MSKYPAEQIRRGISWRRLAYRIQASSIPKTLVFALVILTSSGAFAYVFTFKNSGFAAFVGGTVADTEQSSQAYSRTSGNQTSFGSAGVQYGFSGQAGFQYNFSDSFALRAGVEGYESKEITANGTDNAGNSAMSVDSSATVIIPNVGAEFTLFKRPAFRTYLLIDGGYAMATISNKYSVTTFGQTDYGLSPSSSNYNEEFKGSTVSGIAGLGAEFYTFDNVTMTIEAGYRYMQFADLSYGSGGTAIRGNASTTTSSGATVNDNGGNSVSINMSGLFVGFIFRFYLPQM